MILLQFMNKGGIMKYCVGQKDTFIREITREKVQAFAEFSGDYNPIHLDEEYAKRSRFGKCIAHGMIAGAFISAIIGTEFPGKGTIYLKQDMKFLKPIYIGEEIKIMLELVEIQENNRAEIITDVVNENGEKVITGRARVILPVV